MEEKILPTRTSSQSHSYFGMFIFMSVTRLFHNGEDEHHLFTWSHAAMFQWCWDS